MGNVDNAWMARSISQVNKNAVVDAEILKYIMEKNVSVKMDIISSMGNVENVKMMKFMNQDNKDAVKNVEFLKATMGKNASVELDIT